MRPDTLTYAVNSPRHLGHAEHSHQHLCALLLVACLALSPLACSTQRESAELTHSPHAAKAALELNDGKKWVVDAPMMVHLRNLERAVQDFETTPGSDHAVLANTIQENLGKLVTNCTMEGKAHDELHKWLMPFLGLSADYVKATEPRAQEEKLLEIKAALVAFNGSFE